MMSMKRKILSDEEIRILMENPYVRDVSNQIVHYTSEFYEMAYEKKSAGYTAREILLSIGIDPALPGTSRVESLNSDLNTWLRNYKKNHPEDPAVAEKQIEINKLREQIRDLNSEIKQLRKNEAKFFNALGYYRAASTALKKKLCFASPACSERTVSCLILRSVMRSSISCS